MFEHVKGGTGDLFLGHRPHQRALIDDGTTRRVDKESRFLHKPQFAGANLMPCLLVER